MTLGDPSERRTQHNIWAYEATPGVGYHEYLVMCEDLGCEPLFVIHCGISHKENVPLDKMDEFVQDALDAIEYANGPADSRWGAVRATAGHPAPFHLKYIEIGNENGGQPYHERWPLFVKSIKARYPDMHIIANHWAGGCAPLLCKANHKRWPINLINYDSHLINLAGMSRVSGPAKAIVLTSESSTDENTLEEPTKVVPKTQTLPVSGPSFRHTFPANSVTVMRLGNR